MSAATRRQGSRRVAGALLAMLAAAAQMAATPSPAKLLDAYHSALQVLERPAFVEYEYTQTRSGPNRIVTEQHRVYRTRDGQERNDTIMINGTAIVPAVSRILRRTVWPYDVAQFAATTDDYDIVLAPAALVSGRKAYGLKLTRKATADFTLNDLFLDMRRFLPVRETFSVSGGNCAGGGIINFGPAGKYWLPTSVQVTCTAQSSGGPEVFKESIRFSSYGFPSAIPADVFNPGGSADSGQATPGAAP